LAGFTPSRPENLVLGIAAEPDIRLAELQAWLAAAGKLFNRQTTDDKTVRV
jgi:hypothetical protein